MEQQYGYKTSVHPDNYNIQTNSLTISSENAQIVNPNNRDVVGNTTPYSPPGFSLSQEPRLDFQFPIPEFKLRSNDNHAENLHHLRGRRQQKHARNLHRLDAARPYLLHPKYIQYRARRRRDTGEDGKDVWDDRLEDAFQNALINIEPLGRKKKSQRGKPHGRNELIAEWILQETGEHRDRKQISSHIQVLNNWLKGIPEWDAVIRADKKQTNGLSRHDYYADSIERVVRQRKAIGSKSHYDSATTLNADSQISSILEDQEKDHLAKMKFDMWVSLPNQMDQALHNYTHLQSSQSPGHSISLEELPDWRISFPDLRSIIDTWNPFEDCDIILLDASFQLMSEFPPKFSKLGISLELDFQHQSSDVDRLNRLKDWSCVTLMYQHGHQVKGASYNDCHAAGVGKVKPFFESKWWASTFTQLTERRKMAEDSKNNEAIEIAQESAKKFFQGLTVMQEISAALYSPTWKNGSAWLNPSISKRMAILLWRFSEAPNGLAGTTTWQKLIPPPDRTDINSPPSLSADNALPALAMDTMIETAEGDIFDAHGILNHNGHISFPDIVDGMNEQLCQDGLLSFTPSAMTQFDGLPMSFELPTAQVRLPSQVFDPQFDTSHPVLENSPNGQNMTTLKLSHNQESDGRYAESFPTHHDAITSPKNQTDRQPLAKFDVNTHRMLQAQLGPDEPDQSEETLHLSQGHSHETNLEPNSQENDNTVPVGGGLVPDSIADDIGDSTLRSQTPRSIYMTASQPVSSSIIRPSLQAHHSFAGVSTVEQLSYESSRQDFEHLLANLQAHHGNRNISILRNDDSDRQARVNIGNSGIIRPQSQPSLFSSHDDYSHPSLILNQFEIPNDTFAEIRSDDFI